MSTKKNLQRSVFLACFVLFGQQSVHALSVAEAPLPVLMEEAQLVVVGTVAGVDVEASGEGGWRSRYTVRVDQVVSGDAPKNLEVLLPGGSRQGRTTVAYGVPRLAVGDRRLLLLERVGGEWMPLGYRLGVIPLWALDTGRGLINGYVHLLAESGDPARWESRCLTYFLETASSADLVREVVEPELAAGFGAWNGVEGAYPSWGYAGATCVQEPVGVERLQPRNIVVFREAGGSWAHPRRVVGLTSTSIDDNTGFIVDADMELNGEFQRFAVDGDLDAFDLRQIVTHEVGHMLGLDHTPVEDAVMYEKTNKGDRDNHVLHPDDAAGLVASHPLSLARADEGPCTLTEPYPQWEPLCPEPVDEGCAAGTQPGALWWVLLLAMLVAVRFRERAHLRR